MERSRSNERSRSRGDRSAALCSAGPGSREAGRDRADSGPRGATASSETATAMTEHATKAKVLRRFFRQWYYNSQTLKYLKVQWRRITWRLIRERLTVFRSIWNLRQALKASRSSEDDVPPLLDSDVAEASPRPLVDSDANSSIGYGNGCNSDGDSVISAIGAVDIPASEALGAANGADGGEVAIAEHGVQIYVDRDATVGQLNWRGQSLPPRFWDDKHFFMGMPPVN